VVKVLRHLYADFLAPLCTDKGVESTDYSENVILEAAAEA